LERARGGAWLPQQLQARQATIHQALGQLERQQQRLLDAVAQQRLELRAVAGGIDAFCQTVRADWYGDIRPAAATARASYRPGDRHRRRVEIR
jgi:hypothetical protein